MLREVAAVILQRCRCREGIEQLPLPFRAGEPHLFGLAVDRRQFSQQTSQGGHGNLSPTNRGARASLGGDLPEGGELNPIVEVPSEGLNRLDHDLADLPTSLHERPVLPIPDQRRIGPGPQQ